MHLVQCIPLNIKCQKTMCKNITTFYSSTLSNDLLNGSSFTWAVFNVCCSTMWTEFGFNADKFWAWFSIYFADTYSSKLITTFITKHAILLYGMPTILTSFRRRVCWHWKSIQITHSTDLRALIFATHQFK